jgi:hypothetical protein
LTVAKQLTFFRQWSVENAVEDMREKDPLRPDTMEWHIMLCEKATAKKSENF